MTTAIQPTSTKVAHGDIRNIQRGRTWEQFKHLQQSFENARGIKLFYYKETIEILMPGQLHELLIPLPLNLCCKEPIRILYENGSVLDWGCDRKKGHHDSS